MTKYDMSEPKLVKRETIENELKIILDDKSDKKSTQASSDVVDEVSQIFKRYNTIKTNKTTATTFDYFADELRLKVKHDLEKKNQKAESSNKKFKK